MTSENCRMTRECKTKCGPSKHGPCAAGAGPAQKASRISREVLLSQCLHRSECAWVSNWDDMFLIAAGSPSSSENGKIQCSCSGVAPVDSLGITTLGSI